MFRFMLKNMRTKRARMALVALSVIISAGVALLSYNVSAQVNDGIQESFIYYDLLIGPAGSSTQLAMNTMFFTDKPLGTISYDYVTELQNSGMVNRVVPFTMGDSYNSARIVGTTPDLLEGKDLASGAMFETDELYGAVIGSAVAKANGLKVGDTMITSHGLSTAGTKHAASPLTVTGILKTTNTNYDNTVFTSYKTVWAIHEHEDEEHGEQAEEMTADVSENMQRDHGGAMTHSGTRVQPGASEEEEEAEAHEGEVCAILVKSKSVAAYGKLTNAYSDNSRLLVINPATVLREVLSQVDTSTQIVYVLCGIILIMNILVITVITLLNLFDSKKEIALMRTIGISMKRVAEMYLIQNGILGLISTLLALVLSHAALMFMNGLTQSRGIVLSALRVYPAELGIALLVFLLSVLPTLICIRNMARGDVLKK